MTAQHMQMPDRALRHLGQVQAKVEEMCKKSLARFRAAPAPKSKAVKKQLVAVLATSQAALHTSDLVTEIYDVVMGFHVEGIQWDE